MTAATTLMKRKRGNVPAAGCDESTGRSHVRPAKRVKALPATPPKDRVKHTLLDLYFPKIQTLREYTLSKLPRTSRIRHRKIASVGLGPKPHGQAPTELEVSLGRLLDTTLVGLKEDTPSETAEPDNRWEKWINFSQKGDESYVTLSDGQRGALFSQAEIVDFVIWLIFSRDKSSSWPKHLLCDGFRKNLNANPRPQHGPGGRGGEIPGLFKTFPNPRVAAMKEDPWPQLLLLLGKAGERIMIDLLLDCSIFIAVEAGRNNLYQLSGIPLHELRTLDEQAALLEKSRPGSASGDKFERSPCEITFVKSRMFYARAALNARGLVHFGLRHIHVLNRFPLVPKNQTAEHAVDSAQQSPENDTGKDSTTRVMMYLFPRQFGLHNVFTSTVDRRQTAQKYLDYTLREEEITQKFSKMVDGKRVFKAYIPKRLKGKARELVERLQVLHSHCAYTELLRHHCPVQDQIEALRKAPSSSAKAHGKRTRAKKKHRNTQDAPKLEYQYLVDLACPNSHVSAFCRAVLAKVIPNEFWGTGTIQEENKKGFLDKVDHFIGLRRFENLSLHDLMQGLKITDIEWLAPPGLQNQKCSQTDLKKRTEIFYEFLYYVFGSILIPLIRSNFYVTESNVHRLRIFYFRHDVWRCVAEPAMAALKSKMFEEVKLDDAMRILASRRLGFSQVRLLPKNEKMRPIMNLKRRVMERGNRKVLGQSINKILEPVNSMLQLEKELRPELLGSTIQSVSDIYTRIKAFKAQQPSNNPPKRFFFAKVDVSAAFDTIPQAAVTALLSRIPSHKRYKIGRHCEMQPAANSFGGVGATTRKWQTSARPVAEDGRKSTPFPELLSRKLHGPATKRTDTVFVDNAMPKFYDRAPLTALLREHVGVNLVRIGKKYYRQREGIPQGSVLSSALCNYFYADLERKHLSFLKNGPGVRLTPAASGQAGKEEEEAAEDKPGLGAQDHEDSLLMRLTDDFLLITTSEAKAVRFIRTMHAGVPEYGVTVGPAKTLVNFDMTFDDVVAVPQIGHGKRFPYCGTLIDCVSLDVAKNRENPKDPVIFNSLTVEFSRNAGRNFKRKVINSFKLQSLMMYYDTSHNAMCAVLRNIYTAFAETATKMWAYARCLGRSARPSEGLVIETIKSVIDVAFLLLTSKTRQRRFPGYKFAVTKAQVSWLATVAIRQVLVRKQTAYKAVITWLEAETMKLSAREEVSCAALVKAVRGL